MWDEAAAEYRQALAMQPDSLVLKLGLAKVFHTLGQSNASLAILESLIKLRDCPPEVSMEYARQLATTGRVDLAAAHYRGAIEKAPELADAHLARQLGVDESVDDGAEVGGRMRLREGEEARLGPIPWSAPRSSFRMSAGWNL